MKTVVSQRYRLNGLVLFVGETVGVIIMLCCGIWLADKFADLVPFIGFALMFYLLVLFVTLCMFKGLLTVHLSETEFVSKFHKKTFCTVDKAKPIYYMRAHAKDDLFVVTDYILISNEQIHWTEKPDAILSKYRLKTQVVIPYNAQTRTYMDFENWTECFPNESKFSKMKGKIDLIACLLLAILGICYLINRLFDQGAVL